jgi:hypothetical protein
MPKKHFGKVGLREPHAAPKTDDFAGAIHLSAFGLCPVVLPAINGLFRGTDYGT